MWKRVDAPADCDTALLAMAALVLTAALPARVAGADLSQFPQKSLRWLSPYAAGGGADLTTRAVAQKLGEQLGQTVIVDNRIGASGKIAVDLASRAPADGYTLMTITSSIMANQDVRELGPLTQMTTQGYVWIVHSSIPAASIRELIALARARPGFLHYGSAGIATMQHIAGAMLGTLTKAELTHVPYKGGALALNDLLGGQLQLLAGDMWSSTPHVKSGRVRALAVTSNRRSALFPELPTTAEAGVAGYIAENWYGVATQVKTPPAIVARLQQEIVRALKSSEVRDRAEQQGADVVGNRIDEFRLIINADLQRWRKVMAEAGIRAE